MRWGSSPTVEITATAQERYPLLAEFLDKASKASVSTDNMQATMFSNLLDVISQELPRLHSGELDAAGFCQAMTDAAAKN